MLKSAQPVKQDLKSHDHFTTNKNSPLDNAIFNSQSEHSQGHTQQEQPITDDALHILSNKGNQLELSIVTYNNIAK